MLARIGIVRAGSEKIKRKGNLRAGYGNKIDF